jgi:hypothetical protein
VDGWVDVASNPYGIQGAVFAYSDGHSAVATDFTGTNVCISGTAPQVDASCLPEAPATDCWGMYWGAALGLNLNQPIDPSTGTATDPLPYDASAFNGFAFDIHGPTVPTSMRFVVDDGLGQKCTTSAKPILAGHNEVFFSELLSECWAAQGTQPDPSSIVMISWHVATNEVSETPFDFCVSNISPLDKVILLK